MYFILANPFWPSLMAITVVLAAVGAGWANAKRVGSKWVLHSLGYYALPALIVVFLGFNYATSTYDTSDFFRCRDAVCKAAAADNANHDYWIKLALVELAALIVLGVMAWLRQWSSERRESRKAVATIGSPPAGLREMVANRFPATINFVPSRGVVKYYQKTWGTLPNIMDDSDWELWQYVIKAFPRQPRTQAESDVNEQKLWDIYVRHLSRETENGVSLVNRQAIIDYFIGHEKWVFRYYYAATGTVHETLAIRMCEVLGERDDAGNESYFEDGSDRRIQKKYSAIDRSEEQLRRFRRDVAMPFVERWGEWFFFNVQDAFRRQKEKQADSRSKIPPNSPGEWEDGATEHRPNI